MPTPKITNVLSVGPAITLPVSALIDLSGARRNDGCAEPSKLLSATGAGLRAMLKRR